MKTSTFWRRLSTKHSAPVETSAFAPGAPHQPAPSWVKANQLLDVASEKKLCDDAQYNKRSVCNRLEWERRSAGEHP